MEFDRGPGEEADRRRVRTLLKINKSCARVVRQDEAIKAIARANEEPGRV